LWLKFNTEKPCAVPGDQQLSLKTDPSHLYAYGEIITRNNEKCKCRNGKKNNFDSNQYRDALKSHPTHV